MTHGKEIPTQLEQVTQTFREIQDSICIHLEALESRQRFLEDSWEYANGGGGRSRVLADGEVIEKGGVNFSFIQGEQLPQAATQKRPQLAGKPFAATGVSLVMHPLNPYVPTSHMNVRYFEAGHGDDKVWWFGGGYDLTPYYGFEDDCRHWHQTLKDVCDVYDSQSYAKYKAWCDDYFYIKHRQEARGVGGVFFDDLNSPDFNQVFDFVSSVGRSYIDAYLPIVKRRYQTPYTQRERDFQLYRRGRYVEFNLVYDRGTLFGLQSGGRTESILMSLPPEVRWEYNYTPKKGSAEAALYDKFLPPRDWLS